MASSSEVEMDEIMSKILFTNLQLLGMNMEDMSQKYKIPFKVDMFQLPNKTGSEAVLYFLFQRMNPTLTGEQFRDCWPVYDRKSESQFRKVCNSWLTVIQRDTANQMPRSNASLLLSPGGRKYIQLLCSFSTHVLIQVMKKENGFLEKDSLERPDFQSFNHLNDVTRDNLQRGQEINTFKLFDQLQLKMAANRKWRDYSSELLRSYRVLTKSLKDLHQEKLVQVNSMAESALKAGCQLPAKRTHFLFDTGKDAYAVKRKERLQKVRQHWQCVKKFHEKTGEKREILQSIMESREPRTVLDGTELGVRVPGLLLRQCKKEIQDQDMDNVYIGGRLNLISMIKLYNLCLKLYLEQLQTDELPDVNEEVPQLAKQAHRHYSHRLTIDRMKEGMDHTIEDLNKSIRRMQEMMEHQCHGELRRNTNGNNLGLGLSTNTPVRPPDMVASSELTPQLDGTNGLASRVLKPQAETQDTPDLISIMRKEVEQSTLKGNTSAHDVPFSFGFLQRLQPKSKQEDVNATRTKRQHVESTASIRKSKVSTMTRKTAPSKRADAVPVGSHGRGKSSRTQTKESSQERNSYNGATPKLNRQQAKAMDLLANSVVSEVMSNESNNNACPGELPLEHLIIDNLMPDFELGEKAFVSRDLLAKSPEKEKDTPETASPSASTFSSFLAQNTTLCEKDSIPLSVTNVMSPVSPLNKTAHGLQTSVLLPSSHRNIQSNSSPQRSERSVALSHSGSGSNDSTPESFRSSRISFTNGTDFPDVVDISPIDSNFLYLKGKSSLHTMPQEGSDPNSPSPKTIHHSTMSPLVASAQHGSSTKKEKLLLPLTDDSGLSIRPVCSDDLLISVSPNASPRRANVADTSIQSPSHSTSMLGPKSHNSLFEEYPDLEVDHLDLLGSLTLGALPGEEAAALPRSGLRHQVSDSQSPDFFLDRPPGDGEASAESSTQTSGQVVFGPDEDNNDVQSDLLDLNQLSSPLLLSPELPMTRPGASSQQRESDSMPVFHTDQYESKDRAESLASNSTLDEDTLDDTVVPNLVSNYAVEEEAVLDEFFVPFRQGILLDGRSPNKEYVPGSSSFVSPVAQTLLQSGMSADKHIGTKDQADATQARLANVLQKVKLTFDSDDD